jgi:hypothetical protein
MATEIDKLDPIPESVTLRSGMVVQLEALRLRQFLKLMRILTHGALPGMREAGLLNIQAAEDTSEFMGRLLSVTLLSIPDAENETVDFVRSLCYPSGLVEPGGKRGLNKQDVEQNQLLWDALDEELVNPDLDDLVTIIEAVIKREAGDVQALGKRLASMFKLAEMTGQMPTSSKSPSPKESISDSSEGSRGRSTSSRRSTAGRTIKSATSLLDGSDNASPRSGKRSTTRGGNASIG